MTARTTIMPPHPEEFAECGEVRVSKDGAATWFETRSHSASKTRVNALMAALLTMRPV
jgi:hypothetical protein